MRVLVKRPGLGIEEKDIKDELESYQREVEGYIEFVHIPSFHERGISVIVNDEGLLLGLPANIYYEVDGKPFEDEILVGNVLFTGTRIGKDGMECCDLTDEQVKFIKSSVIVSPLYRNPQGDMFWKILL